VTPFRFEALDGVFLVRIARAGPRLELKVADVHGLRPSGSNAVDPARDRRNSQSLFDSRTGTPIWDGTTPITVGLATAAEVQTWSDSRVAEERDGTIEPTDYDEWAAYLVPVRSR
jgi:hypothetical protein